MVILIIFLLICVVVAFIYNCNSFFIREMDAFDNYSDSVLLCRCLDGTYSTIDSVGNCSCKKKRSTSKSDYCNVDNSNIYLTAPKYTADFVDIDQIKCEAVLSSPSDYERVHKDCMLKTNKPYKDYTPHEKFYDDLFA